MCHREFQCEVDLALKSWITPLPYLSSPKNFSISDEKARKACTNFFFIFFFIFFYYVAALGTTGETHCVKLTLRFVGLSDWRSDGDFLFGLSSCRTSSSRLRSAG